MVHTFEVDLNGRKITLETGKMAKQANGAVVVRSGDSVVLVTACIYVALNLAADLAYGVVDPRIRR